MLGVNKPTGAAVAVALPEAPSHTQRLHTEFTARLVSWPAKKGSDPSCYSCLLMSPRLDRPSERRLSQAAPQGVWSQGYCRCGQDGGDVQQMDLAKLGEGVGDLLRQA